MFGTSSDQEIVIKSGLYSQKQLFITASIGGPAIAAFIISFNLWARDKRSYAFIPILPGLILGLVILFINVSVIQFITDHYPRILSNIILRHVVAFGLYFLFLRGFASILRYILKRNKQMEAYIFPDFDVNIFHYRKLYPVIVISFIYLLTILTFNIYLFSVLVFYLFTHIYSYNLIHKSFGNSKIAKPFLVSVVILACFLPIIDTTGHMLYAYGHLKLLSFTYLNLVVGYYTVFIFYVFLIILSLHLLQLINSLIRIVPIKIIKNKTFVLVSILFTIVFGVTTLVFATYTNNNPIINKYSVTLPKKSSTLSSLKVISISDLHLKNITSRIFLKKLSDKVRLAEPDIILLPGDIAETYGNTSKEKLNEFIEILKDIIPENGIYAVRGNHDLPGPNVADEIDFNKRMAITLIADSLIELGSKICIIGLNYRSNNEKRPIDSILKFRTKDLPIILLDHAPYCLGEAIKNKIDVQLSGHTHHGQLWPLNYVTDAVYNIAWGYKKINNTHLFVSCGVQDAIMPGYQDLSVPVRTGSVSEILEINIEFR